MLSPAWARLSRRDFQNWGCWLERLQGFEWIHIGVEQPSEVTWSLYPRDNEMSCRGGRWPDEGDPAGLWGCFFLSLKLLWSRKRGPNFCKWSSKEIKKKLYWGIIHTSLYVFIEISFIICQEAFNRSFLCAVLDLSGILCSLLVPEYSGIKRRGKPLPGAEESRPFLH